MKKVLVLAIILGSTLFLSYQNGPLPENTGAPNEMTCYRSTCHTNNGSGNAEVFLRFTDSALTYRNMDTMLLEFGFSKVFSTEHGFQMVALDSLNRNAGQWVLGGSNQYQQISGFSFPNRKYLEHIAPGTSSSTWMVEWIPPGNYQGEISFYASFLETNDNDLPTGDTLYNLQLHINHDHGVGLASTKTHDKAFRVASSENTLMFHNNSEQLLSVQVFSLNGVSLCTFQSEANSHDIEYLKSGVYILAVSSNLQSSFATEKISIP